MEGNKKYHIDKKYYIGRKGKFVNNSDNLRDELKGCSFLFVEHFGRLRHLMIDGVQKNNMISCNIEFEKIYWNLLPNNDFEIEE
jgi:hypothetical protein